MQFDSAVFLIEQSFYSVSRYHFLILGFAAPSLYDILMHNDQSEGPTTPEQSFLPACLEQVGVADHTDYQVPSTSYDSPSHYLDLDNSEDSNQATHGKSGWIGMGTYGRVW